MDLIVTFILSVIILLFGLSAYQKTQKSSSLLIGLAFGLFAISDAVSLLGMADQFVTELMILRIFAYLTILYALYQWSGQEKK